MTRLATLKGVQTMQTIRFECQDAVGRIVLANPPFNRLDLQFSECLRQAVHDASQSDIRVLVIQAEGPHFSFGGEVREWPGKDVNWVRTIVAEVQLSYRAIPEAWGYTRAGEHTADACSRFERSPT